MQSVFTVSCLNMVCNSEYVKLRNLACFRLNFKVCQVMRELKKSSILQIANLSVDQITRFVICQITCSNQSNSPGPTAYLPRANLWLMDRIDADYQIACGSKEKQHILSCISATVFTKSSARKKTTACCNSDQSVGESSLAP